MLLLPNHAASEGEEREREQRRAKGRVVGPQAQEQEEGKEGKGKSVASFGLRSTLPIDSFARSLALASLSCRSSLHLASAAAISSG